MLKIGYLTSKKVVFSAIGLLVLLSIIIKIILGPKYEMTAPTGNPDLVMKDVIAIRMSTEGKPETRINTPSFIYYNDVGEGELQTPFIRAYTVEDSSWEIFSRSGRTDKGLDGLLLTDGVTMRHGMDDPTTAIVVRTDNLLIETENSNAQTQAPVQILLANSTINAVGMVADFSQSLVELLTDLRAEHGNTSN